MILKLFSKQNDCTILRGHTATATRGSPGLHTGGLGAKLLPKAAARPCRAPGWLENQPEHQQSPSDTHLMAQMLQLPNGPCTASLWAIQASTGEEPSRRMEENHAATATLFLFNEPHQGVTARRTSWEGTTRLCHPTRWGTGLCCHPALPPGDKGGEPPWEAAWPCRTHGKEIINPSISHNKSMSPCPFARFR